MIVELKTIFAKGCILGFSLAMILGPIGIFCIQQTLSNGFWAGMAVGLGAALADGIYGTIAGLGLTFIIDLLIKQQFWLQIIGGILLCYLGIRCLRTKAHDYTTNTTVKSSLVRLFTSTLFLTLANPVTIITFTALIASLGITATTCSLSYALVLFSSVFIGSITWWIILSGGLSLVRKRISTTIVHKINLIAGALMLCFGLLALLMLLV